MSYLGLVPSEHSSGSRTLRGGITKAGSKDPSDMDDEQIEALYPLTLQVRRLFHRLGHDVTALHTETGITAGMRAVLESVIAKGPQTVPDMARVRPVSRQHIQGLVNALLAAGLIETIDNPAHRRSRLVRATDAGQAAYDRLRAREAEAFRRLPLGIAAAELNLAARVLATVLEALEGAEWRSIVADAVGGRSTLEGQN